jgi:hypothetical protein
MANVSSFAYKSEMYMHENVKNEFIRHITSTE